MMSRILLLALVAGVLGGNARGSDEIMAPMEGASASVSQPHVVAELIPERTTIAPGEPFDVALHLHMDPGWHTYWVNPGDAGLATMIKWTLPPGFTAGPIQWPTPEKHAMGPLVTYGYGGDVYLLTTITPPKGDLPQHFDVKAKATWLVCQEECIPGKAELTLPLDSGMLNLRLPVENTDFFAQARERMPVTGDFKQVSAAYKNGNCIITFITDNPLPAGRLKSAYFFAVQSNVVNAAGNQMAVAGDYVPGLSLSIPLVQNGDSPAQLSGVLVSDEALIGKAKAVYVPSFPVTSEVAAAVPSGGTAQNSGQLPVASGNPDNKLSGPPGGEANSGDGHRPPLQLNGNAPPPLPAQGPAPATLLTVLGAAFIGGLILNLMPCVLPVLSLKVFSLMKHAGDTRRAWVQGVAFTVGVVLSFWVLAGLLLVLRSAGNHLGWGFQMQDPRFVLGLIFLFFLLGLNLFGVFELGTSLVGLDAKAAGKLGGVASSFGNGALATLAATPCTAPFMGSALGFAAQQPAFVSMLIFTALALGMAAPYLLLTIFPGALRFVPKPGAWMEAFKQFMGFLLMGTVIFLVYVFGALTGGDSVPWLLFTLLLAGIAAWIYGRWSSPLNSGFVRGVAMVLAAGILVYAIGWGVSLAQTPTVARSATATTEATGDWQPWSQAAVDAALAKGQPVFVDFTAAWCLSCKVNEKVALDTDAVKKAFADKNVALFVADWTHSDPEISQALQKFGRDGVPLYLVYSPKNPATPQVLPEVLTPGIVLDALGKL